MLLLPETLQKASEIDPTILEFVQQNPSPPLDWDDAEAVAATMRAIEVAALAQIGPPESTLVEHGQQIAMRDDYMSTIKVHKPVSEPAEGSPLIVLLFGGGFISGSSDQLTPNARALVRALNAVVVNISYRLGPTHKFPKAIEDCSDSVKWLAAHAGELGADPTKGFIIGGVSAGGNASAVVTTLAAEEKLNPPITGVWLSAPLIFDDAGRCVPEQYKKHFSSRKQNAEAPVVNQAALDSITHHIAWDAASPLRLPTRTKAPLSCLPPTYLQACGMDPLRDDALIYEEMLKEAGVKTRIDLYPGCPHAHFAFMPGLDLSNKALGDIIVNIGWLLGKDVSAEEALKAYATPT